MTFRLVLDVECLDNNTSKFYSNFLPHTSTSSNSVAHEHHQGSLFNVAALNIDEFIKEFCVELYNGYSSNVEFSFINFGKCVTMLQLATGNKDNFT